MLNEQYNYWLRESVPLKCWQTGLEVTLTKTHRDRANL